MKQYYVSEFLENIHDEDPERIYGHDSLTGKDIKKKHFVQALLNLRRGKNSDGPFSSQEVIDETSFVLTSETTMELWDIGFINISCDIDGLILLTPTQLGKDYLKIANVNSKYINGYKFLELICQGKTLS